MSGYVVATTHKARGGRYPEPLPTQHALAADKPRNGGGYRPACGGTVVHVSDAPFNPDHPKACPTCRQLVAP